MCFHKDLELCTYVIYIYLSTLKSTLVVFQKNNKKYAILETIKNRTLDALALVFLHYYFITLSLIFSKRFLVKIVCDV